MLKVRIRFSKVGALVYIGHLDVMRYFQKLLRRAHIPVAYSEGFSPHQILSFTPPLPLGMESTGEYADVELTERISAGDALSALDACTVPEIGIMSFKELPEKCESAMAQVAAARYILKPESIPFAQGTKEAVGLFMKAEEAVITKKTKKNERDVNIRPLVYELTYDSGRDTIEMLISSGSTDNIKPEHVLTAIRSMAGCDFPETLCITRVDQYAAACGRFISLDDIGYSM